MKLRKYENFNLKIEDWQVVKVLFEIDGGGEQKGKEEWWFFCLGFFVVGGFFVDLGFVFS